MYFDFKTESFNDIFFKPVQFPRIEDLISFYLNFQNVAHNSKLRSKRGLLPFIELNGEEICDSDIIIKTLTKKFEKDMDDGLTAEQKNVQHAMVTMVQNHLQW